MMNDHADYDSPWKAMLEGFFQEFMTFFFPAIAKEIDWRGYEFLDKELQQVVRDAEVGRRIADKLVKVKRLDAPQELWVFIHIEVQGFYETSFEERMYVYNYRLFDRYHQPICSLAVLADERADWKPTRFQYEIWGCQETLTFPVVKLLEYRAREAELEASENPFALIVLAYLKTLETKQQPELRLDWKVRLFRLLYQRGSSKQDSLELMRFLDWVMVLPDALAQRFETTIAEDEEARKVQYVTSFERIGMEKGVQQGLQQGIQQGIQQGLQQGLRQGRERGQLEQSRIAVIDVLNIRFKVVPTTIITMLLQCEDVMWLQKLLQQAVTISSLAEFEIMLRQAVAEDSTAKHVSADIK